MEFLEKFGIDYRLILAQILNFCVLLFVLYRFAYGPVMRALEKRRQTIAQSLADAKELATRTEEGEEARKETLHLAEQEASAIVADARGQAERAREAIVASTRLETEAMRAQAQRDAEAFAQQALARAQGELADMVTNAASMVIGERLTDDRDRALIHEAIKKVKQS